MRCYHPLLLDLPRAARSDRIAPADRDSDISTMEQYPPGSNYHHPLSEPILAEPSDPGRPAPNADRLPDRLDRRTAHDPFPAAWNLLKPAIRRKQSRHSHNRRAVSPAWRAMD